MSPATVQMQECAAAALEQLRTLSAYGPLPSDTVLYETDLILKMTVASIFALRNEMQNPKPEIRSVNTGESPALAELFGR